MSYVRKILEEAVIDLMTDYEANEYLYDHGIRSVVKYRHQAKLITNELNEVKDCLCTIEE